MEIWWTCQLIYHRIVKHIAQLSTIYMKKSQASLSYTQTTIQKVGLPYLLLTDEEAEAL